MPSLHVEILIGLLVNFVLFRSPSPVKSHIRPAAKKQSPDSYIKSAAKPRVHDAVAAPHVTAAPVPPSPGTPRVGNRVSYFCNYSVVQKKVIQCRLVTNISGSLL